MTQFEYVAVLISIIAGLALTQILRGVGRMVTTENGPRPYWVHLVWTFYLFISTTYFWWWEFRLTTIEWSMTLYLIVIVYATLYFFASLLIQPGNLEGIEDYEKYFYSRRRWIFGLFIALILWDFVDTVSKGVDHLFSFGITYPALYLSFVAASIIAIVTENRRYHELFAPIWFVVYIIFMYRVNYMIE